MLHISKNIKTDSHETTEKKKVNKFWFDDKCEKKRDDIKNSFKGKSSNPLERQLKEKFNQKLKEYEIMCNSKSPCFGTLE